MKQMKLLGLSLLSGLLMYLSWHPQQFTFLIFISWLPLLHIANTVTKKVTFFFYSFVALFVWNIATTWWICNSTDVGGIAAIVANSLIMTLPLLAFFSVNKRLGYKNGIIALISFWMCFEYVHLNWQLSWPWLSLGNVFAGKTDWIQWYELTGIGGGTLWVLLVNVLVYQIVTMYKKFSFKKKAIKVVALFLLVALPITVSLFLGFHFTKGGQSGKVVIVQPNIDPYQKFESLSVSSQIEKLIGLSEKSVDTTTKLVIWPETALSANIALNEITTIPVYQPVFAFLQKHPNITLLTGVETYQFVENNSTSPYKRKTPQGGFYESYNGAIALNSKEQPQFYIKSKLVPGVETLPSFLNIMAPIFEKFGGTTGGYAKDTASKVFINTGSPFIAAPVICYESIYGDYVASYVKRGANLICIMTNDGWWGNTPGHKQHLAYAKLRAIETRTWVARSANTGISAVISPYGYVQEERSWDTAATITYNFPITKSATFYVKHGDYLYQLFSILAIIILGWNIYAKFRKR